MATRRIGLDQAIAELNSAYEKQDGYDPNNRFRQSPDGAKASGIQGYDLGPIGTSGAYTPAHERALKHVYETFEIELHR